MEAGFPRSARVLSPDEYARIFAARQSAAQGALVMYARPAQDPGQRPRLGLSVSRRVGGAVIRNRWKRRLREAFRSVRRQLPPGNDFVLVVRPGPVPTGAVGARVVENTLVELAARIVSRSGYRQGSARQVAGAAARRRRR